MTSELHCASFTHEQRTQGTTDGGIPESVSRAAGQLAAERWWRRTCFSALPEESAAQNGGRDGGENLQNISGSSDQKIYQNISHNHVCEGGAVL